MPFAQWTRLFAPLAAVCAGLLLAASPAPSADPVTLTAPCQTDAPACGWKISWQNEGTVFDTVAAGDHAALRIANDREGVGFVEREYSLPTTGLALLRFTARVKVDGARGRGAGLNLALLDGDGNMIASHTMGYADFGMAKGTRDWQAAEIAIALPPNVRRIKLGLILYGRGAAAFDGVAAEVRPVANVRPSRFARRYVDEAIAIASKHSLRRAEVDFEALRRDAYRIAGPARTAREAWPAIRYILDGLEDGHSFFMSRDEKEAWQAPAPSAAPETAGPMPRMRNIDGIGYIAVPGFHSDHGPRKIAFAQAIHDALRDLSAAGVTGWVIDLRENDGGNMFPMLAGLAPLFDAPTLGYLVDIDGKREPWGVDPSLYGKDESWVPVARPATLPRRLPIAVLYGPRTGSSGEIVILSFVGNALTRSFGEPSYGLTTGNGIFALSDGSEMRMASTHMADRTGRTYEGRVSPDVIVAPAATGDPALAAGLAWLREPRP